MALISNWNLSAAPAQAPPSRAHSSTAAHSTLTSLIHRSKCYLISVHPGKVCPLITLPTVQQSLLGPTYKHQQESCTVTLNSLSPIIKASPFGNSAGSPVQFTGKVLQPTAAGIGLTRRNFFRLFTWLFNGYPINSGTGTTVYHKLLCLALFQLPAISFGIFIRSAPSPGTRRASELARCPQFTCA